MVILTIHLLIRKGVNPLQYVGVLYVTVLYGFLYLYVTYSTGIYYTGKVSRVLCLHGEVALPRCNIYTQVESALTQYSCLQYAPVWACVSLPPFLVIKYSRHVYRKGITKIKRPLSTTSNVYYAVDIYRL